MVERQGATPIAVLVGLDQKSVQRYIAAAAEADLDRGRAHGSPDERANGQGYASRPGPTADMGKGSPGQFVQAHHDQLKAWLIDNGLTAVRVNQALKSAARRGGSRLQARPRASAWRNLRGSSRDSAAGLRWPAYTLRACPPARGKRGDQE